MARKTPEYAECVTALPSSFQVWRRQVRWGLSRIYGSLEDYKTECKRLTSENERLVSALTESHEQNRILSRAAEIGQKVLEGSVRGGQAPKIPQRPLSK